MQTNGSFDSFEEMVEWLETEAQKCNEDAFYSNSESQGKLGIKYMEIALAMKTLGCAD